MNRKWMKTPKKLGPRLYQHTNGTFYYSFTINGQKDRKRALKAITPRMAAKEGQKKQADHDSFCNGLSGMDPFAESVVETQTTVGALYAKWESEGCPDLKTLRPLEGERRMNYINGLRRVKGFFVNHVAEELNQKHLDDFMLHMIKDVPQGQMLAATDKALTKLSSLLKWGVRRSLIKFYPLAKKVHYQEADKITHCSELKPASDEELHSLARWFFNKPHPFNWRINVTTETLGWQLLFEAYTGCRTSEILAMRMDAKEGEPGFVNWTRHWLGVNRLKRGIHPWIPFEQIPGVHPLVDLIHAHKAWHKERFKNHPTPWYFPNKHEGVRDSNHLDRSSLSHALTNASKALDLPRRTSHGLRAFYVHTARSLGMSDVEISIRLGHRSGADLVKTTYGSSEPNWIGSMEQDWLPEKAEEVAYAKWLGTAEGTIFDANIGVVEFTQATIT